VPKQRPANRTPSSTETETLQKQVETLVDALSEDAWNAAQRITVADLLENPVTALAFNSFLANYEKLKNVIPVDTQEDVASLSAISKDLNRACGEIRTDMFKLLNELVSTKNKSKSEKVKIMHLLPEEMHGFAMDALRGMNDAGLATKHGICSQTVRIWANTMVNSGWLAAVPEHLLKQIRSHQILKAAGLKKNR